MATWSTSLRTAVSPPAHKPSLGFVPTKPIQTLPPASPNRGYTDFCTDVNSVLQGVCNAVTIHPDIVVVTFYNSSYPSMFFWKKSGEIICLKQLPADIW